MPDCKNSPDGYHEWQMWIRTYKSDGASFAAARCKNCPAKLDEPEIAAILNAAERLSAKSAEIIAESLPDNIFSNELRAYAARRKDGE